MELKVVVPAGIVATPPFLLESITWSWKCHFGSPPHLAHFESITWSWKDHYRSHVATEDYKRIHYMELKDGMLVCSNHRKYSVESITWSWKPSELSGLGKTWGKTTNPLHGVERSHEPSLGNEVGIEESITWSWKFPQILVEVPPDLNLLVVCLESITWSWKTISLSAKRVSGGNPVRNPLHGVERCRKLSSWGLGEYKRRNPLHGVERT